MSYLKHCLILKIPNAQQCRLRELNPSFLYDFHDGATLNEHQYIEKISLNMGRFYNYVLDSELFRNANSCMVQTIKANYAKMKS
jgi:hypothetical protein